MSGIAQDVSAEPGDVIVIGGHHLGESPRKGEVLEVLGEPGHPHYRVRWDDDRETVFYPSSDATIHRHEAVRAKRKPARWPGTRQREGECQAISIQHERNTTERCARHETQQEPN